MMKAKNQVKACNTRALLPILGIRKYTIWFLLQMISDVPSMLYYEADKWLARNMVKAFGIHCATENKLET